MNKLYRGYVDENKKMIFSHYKINGREQWYSFEAWEKRKERQKNYIKSDESKNYQKEWYNNNKENRIAQTTKYRKNRAMTLPLKILVGNSKGKCNRRNLEFSIDYDYITELWNKQNGKCYYTNVDMKLIALTKNPFQVSIDRIDSSKGYIVGNIVLCCQSINYMKNDYSLTDFIEFYNSVIDEGIKLRNIK